MRNLIGKEVQNKKIATMSFAIGKSAKAREERRQKWWSEHKDDGDKSDETCQTSTLKRKHSDSASVTKTKRSKAPSNKAETRSPSSSKEKSKKYYIIFVGNINKEATETEIVEHFLHIGGIKDVRLLTHKDTGKSRGCAYVEFLTVSAHKKALQLHHSMFMGGRLNVEFTSAGRKTDRRMASLKEKNEKAAQFKLGCEAFSDPSDNQQPNKINLEQKLRSIEGNEPVQDNYQPKADSHKVGTGRNNARSTKSVKKNIHKPVYKQVHKPVHKPIHKPEQKPTTKKGKSTLGSGSARGFGMV